MSYAGHAYAVEQQPAPNRRRALGIILALAAELLIVLILLTLGQRNVTRKTGESVLKGFQLEADADSAEKSKAEQQKPQARAKKPAASSVSPPKKPTPPVPPPPPLPVAASNYVQLSREEFAATDIGKLPSRKGAAAAEDSEGEDSAAAYGPGQGPGGQPLYNAEWYREPSRAELAHYIPANFTTGWALIACKTAADFRVENCQSLGESPPGSGLARGMREAAWQFRVLPPRIGGKKVIGAWVRIRIDFSPSSSK